MKLFIEEYPYKEQTSKDLLEKILKFEQGGAYSTDMVGYYYSNDVKDTVFFLPKVVMDEKDRVFHKYNPEDIVDLQDALEKKIIEKDDYEFLYGLSVWIYRAISVFRETTDEKHKKILLYRDIPSDNLSGEAVYNTFLDILISLQRFNNENQDYFTFVLKNIHSGYNKINWTKTISHNQAIIQENVPIYVDVINRKRQVNLEEELFIIFFSILYYMKARYGFSVNINYNFPLITDDAFENYLEGYGEVRLIQIRHKYFADKQIQMWRLCYDFFSKQSQIRNNSHYSDHLLAKNFNIVFEEMIDHLLSEKDERVDKMKLKEQIDGKRVDHIYAYKGLIHNQKEIFYIGDSKYYKLDNDPGSESVYKQYTYARNVIQANLNLFNKDDEGKSGANKDYLVYLDRGTEGYNITPNFFIRAHVADDKDYESDDLIFRKSEEPNFHFRNRLFDRDTLLLQHYDVNFLYILSIYGSNDTLAQNNFKKEARKLFRDKIMEELSQNYQFFSLQLKPVKISLNDDEDDEPIVDKMNRVIEQKYFHKVLGKAFRPYVEEEFMYLSLEHKEEYYTENEKLLSELSQDFNIRNYILGSDPRDSINKFYQFVKPVIAQPGIIQKAEPLNATLLKYENVKDEVFLIGGYRSDKNQLGWILDKAQYNVRYDERTRGRKIQVRNGVVHKQNVNVVSARFLILYDIADENYLNYHVYRLGEFKIRSEKWMQNHEYPQPSGQYIVYDIISEELFEKVSLKTLLDEMRIEEMEELRRNNPKALDGDWEMKWKGSPIFKTGEELLDYRN